MNGPWKPRVCPLFDPEVIAPREADWGEAQDWCNFVLMRPVRLPRGLSEASTSLRPEGPPGRLPGDAKGGAPTWTLSNRCCHRSEYSGGDRRLRIKQFLYDWAPPAFDHPSLWRSTNRPFPVGDHIGWLGLDFRGLPAAAVCVDRTTVEVSVLQGHFDGDELESLCRDLSPAVPGLRRTILATPFADLCYQARHQEPPVQVPVGYWRHRRELLSPATLVLHGGHAPSWLPGLSLCMSAPGGYALDSLLAYGGPIDFEEVDYVFGHRDDPGRSLRLLTSPAGTPGGIAYPPTLDEQPCSSQIRTLHGRSVYHAFLDDRFGQHEAVWQADGLTLMLLAKPAPWSDSDWFLGLLGDFL